MQAFYFTLMAHMQCTMCCLAVNAIKFNFMLHSVIYILSKSRGDGGWGGKKFISRHENCSIFSFIFTHFSFFDLSVFLCFITRLSLAKDEGNYLSKEDKKHQVDQLKKVLFDQKEGRKLSLVSLQKKIPHRSS